MGAAPPPSNKPITLTSDTKTTSTTLRSITTPARLRGSTRSPLFFPLFFLLLFLLPSILADPSRQSQRTPRLQGTIPAPADHDPKVMTMVVDHQGHDLRRQLVANTTDTEDKPSFSPTIGFLIIVFGWFSLLGVGMCIYKKHCQKKNAQVTPN